MIFVTVGTHFRGFERLVRAADELAGELDEPVIIQAGSSTYAPTRAQSFTFVSGEQMEAYVREARLVIAHAAAGTILLVLRLEKPLVVVPRLKAFNEVLDDHQWQLARALYADGRAVMVEEPTVSTLREAMASCIQPAGKARPTREELVGAVRRQLDGWRGENPGDRPRKRLRF